MNRLAQSLLLRYKIQSMKALLPLFVFLMISSCIPFKIAPQIDYDKVMIAKKFKKKLPKKYALIFEDPKQENAFYDFIDRKYQLDYDHAGTEIPIVIDGRILFMSYYETEKATKTINLFPILFDGFLLSKGQEPWFEELEYSRNGHWYLALIVTDIKGEDCISPTSPHRKEVLQYLRALRIEYLEKA